MLAKLIENGTAESPWHTVSIAAISPRSDFSDGPGRPDRARRQASNRKRVETPGDLFQVALGFAVCVWFVINFFNLPKTQVCART
jgi:hypothetical protein